MAPPKRTRSTAKKDEKRPPVRQQRQPPRPRTYVTVDEEEEEGEVPVAKHREVVEEEEQETMEMLLDMPEAVPAFTGLSEKRVIDVGEDGDFSFRAPKAVSASSRTSSREAGKRKRTSSKPRISSYVKDSIAEDWSKNRNSCEVHGR